MGDRWVVEEDKRQRASRAIVAATIGNALEFYDFITFGFFALQIGRTFFPSHDSYVSLMASLATFGAGFLTRPLGGIVIGRYADRVGRKPAMILSFLLMGVSIVALALVPSYAAIGLSAPVLVVIVRMVQGFSLGGEVGPTTAYLLEAAPPEKRGLYVAWQGASQASASITAGLVGFVLSLLMTKADLDAYGWRIAFLLGALAIPYGLWVRRNVPETIHVPEEGALARPGGKGFVNAVRDNARIIVVAFVALASGTTATYISNYLVTFAQATLHMPARVAFAASVVRDLVSLGASLLGGFVSDKVGRRPVLLFPRFLTLLLIYPVYAWIVEARDAMALFLGYGVLTFVGAFSGGPLYAAFSESLPKPIRGRSIAIIYAAAITIFGSTTQLVATWLLRATGNPMALAWYLFAASAIGTVAIVFLLESAPVRVAQRLASVPAQ